MTAVAAALITYSASQCCDCVCFVSARGPNLGNRDNLSWMYG